MAIVDEDISGRLGTYNLSIYDKTQTQSTLESPELKSDVVIEFGELSRSPLRQVIKSYISVSFVDEGLKLHEKFRGGFDKDRYALEVRGPDVDWKGLIRRETRTVPLSNRVNIETTNITAYGGIAEGRVDAFNKDDQNKNDAYFIKNITRQLEVPIDRDGTSDEDKEWIRTSVEFDRWDGNTYQIDQIPTEVKPINMYRNSNIYESIKSFNKLSKHIFYKSLSEGSVVFDSAQLVGSQGSCKSRDSVQSDFVQDTRPEFINEFDVENVIIEGEGGFEDLEKLGRVRVEFDKDHNIAFTGARNFPDEDITNDDNTTDIAVWEEATENTFEALVRQYHGIDLEQNVLTKTGLENASGDLQKGELFLGKIDPQGEIGIVIDYNVITAFGNSDESIKLEYRGNSGFSTTEKPLGTSGRIVGDRTTDLINPKITVENEGDIYIKARYVSGGNEVIESLIANVEERGVEDIVIDEYYHPLIQSGHPKEVSSDPVDLTETKKIRDTVLNIENHQPYLFRAALEIETRPIGTQTLRGKLLGLYGPEYVHKVVEDSEVRYFLPTGLKCNITTGITEAALVEVPNHTLA